MNIFNIKNNYSPEKNYQQGLLPQRNKKNLYYRQSSCRSQLANFSLSSENRRILNKTKDYSYQIIPLKNFNFNSSVQKTISSWIKKLTWDFPTSSVKTIFTHHIFNYVYVWKNSSQKIIAYGICYISKSISHIAYVFYEPSQSHTNLPIRLSLQVVIDSQAKNLKYCYLGRFSKQTGYYKRNMPAFQHYDYQKKLWLPYKKSLNKSKIVN